MPDKYKEKDMTKVFHISLKGYKIAEALDLLDDNQSDFRKDRSNADATKLKSGSMKILKIY